MDDPDVRLAMSVALRELPGAASYRIRIGRRTPARPPATGQATSSTYGPGFTPLTPAGAWTDPRVRLSGHRSAPGTQEAHSDGARADRTGVKSSTPR